MPVFTACRNSAATVPGRPCTPAHRQSLCLLAGLAALFLAVLAGSPARAQDATSRFDIQVQDVAEALYWFSGQSGVGVILPPDFPKQNTLERLYGTYRHREALRLLLRGTDHRAQFVSPTIVRVVRRPQGIRQPPARWPDPNWPFDDELVEYRPPAPAMAAPAPTG